MARKIRHLVAIRIGMNNVAEGDEYLDYLDETLERAVKPWSALLGGVLEMKWQVLKAEGHSNRERSGMVVSSLWPA